jgi:hypothetical protein
VGLLTFNGDLVPIRGRHQPAGACCDGSRWEWKNMKSKHDIGTWILECTFHEHEFRTTNRAVRRAFFRWLEYEFNRAG